MSLIILILALIVLPFAAFAVDELVVLDAQRDGISPCDIRTI